MVKKQYVITLLVGIFAMSSLFMALPEASFAQEEGCCQYVDSQTGEFSCVITSGPFGCPLPGEGNPVVFIDFFADSSCDLETGLCSGFDPVTQVPTLSEWGMIAMAGVLGLVGFMIVRRKRATA